MYLYGVVAIQPMLDTPLWVQEINHLVDLGREGISERYYLVVLGHLVEEMLCMGAEHMGFGFLAPMAEHFHSIYHQSVLGSGVVVSTMAIIITTTTTQVWVGGNCQEWDHVMEVSHAQEECKILQHIVEGVLYRRFG